MAEFCVAFPRALAGIASFRNRTRLMTALHAKFGVAIPDRACWVQASEVTLSCLAPGRYLASADPQTDLAADLAKDLDGVAAVTEQTDMWATFAVSGSNVGDALARIVPVDLHPERFSVGALALTRGGHLDLRVWRVANDVYEISVTRSYAGSLHTALEAACHTGISSV